MNIDSIFGMESDLAWILLFSLIAVVIGGLLFFTARRNYKLAKKTRSWSQTTGTIIKSDIFSSGGFSSGRNEKYSPEIHYRYVVDKQEYHSSQIFVGSLGKSGSHMYADKYVSKYPVGKQVKVYYAPNIYQLSHKEKCAVLEQGVNYNLYVSGFLGVLITGAGSAGAYFILQQEYTHGVLMAIGSIALGIWLGHKLSGSAVVGRKKYKVSRNRLFGKIPGTDGFAGGRSNQIMDIFFKSGDSVLSKRKWRVKVK
ncbi:MAG: DUF3592 domain-containing protein [Bdellovibrionales bacterium]|nr:DUF3592 domain-containing protein [Bdellovibrionales bacterium]